MALKLFEEDATAAAAMAPADAPEVDTGVGERAVINPM